MYVLRWPSPGILVVHVFAKDVRKLLQLYIAKNVKQSCVMSATTRHIHSIKSHSGTFVSQYWLSKTINQYKIGCKPSDKHLVQTTID